VVDVPGPSVTAERGAGAQGAPAGTPRRAAPGPVALVVGSLWRFFASVRVAIWMIGFLTLLTLVGTVRGSVLPDRAADLVPALRGPADALYDWDVFGSRLYAATIALIAVGIIVGGMLNRIPGLWATIVRPTVTTTRGFLTGTAPHTVASADATPDALLADLSAALRRRRYRVLTRTVGDETHVYADRNRWGKLGTFPFHIALVMVAVGGIVVTQLGFRDVTFTLAEGETVAVGRADLSVRLDRFTDAYYQDGTASEFRSAVTVFQGGDVLASGDVQPNHPLSAGGVTLYQAGFGYTVQLRVTDAAGTELFRGPVRLGEYAASANPDAPAGLQAIPGTDVTLTVIASDRDPANRPDLDTLGLASQQIYVVARDADQLGTVTPPAARIDPSAPARLGDLNVAFERYGTFSNLQVAYYPGLWLFGLAAALGIGGLAAIFYFPHRRVRAIVAPDGPGRSRLLVAPLARRDWSGKRDFVQLVGDLRDRTGLDVRLREEPVRGRADGASA
jgi:cytochrome c biogenesis protein